LYIRSIDRQLISEEGMFELLSRGDVKAETGSEISAQVQALQTNYRATKILKQRQHMQLCQQWYNRPHYIGMPNIGKRTIHKET